MVGGLLVKSSQSPAAAKSLYLPSARVCYRRNNNYNTLLSSSGVNHTLVFSPPRYKLDNVILRRSLSACIRFNFLLHLCLYFHINIVLAISIYLCTCNCHIVEIVLGVLLLAPILSILALPLSLLMLAASIKMLVVFANVLLILAKILSIWFAFYITVPPVVALLNGFFYFLQLCMDDRKSVLVLQVGVLDKLGELQREFAHIADTSNSDAMKLEGVMKTLVQHFDSCHFAYKIVTECISDAKMKCEHENDEVEPISVHDPLQFAVYNRLKCFVNTLVETIYGAAKTNKKINYEDKCSKQLFREVLASELVRYDKDKKTSANIDGMEYEDRVVGKEISMVANEYLVVTILVLASGVYSIPSSVGNIKHVKTALQEFNAIPKSKIESLEVLWTRDEVVSDQELKRDFPLLEPIDL